MFFVSFPRLQVPEAAAPAANYLPFVRATAMGDFLGVKRWPDHLGGSSQLARR